MSIKQEWDKSVGSSFIGWTGRIYPTHLLVGNSTDYLRVLRSRMLTVVRRIDDELKRREHRQA